MARIVIRNIDEAVIEALQRRAAAVGISIEEQARRILTGAAGLDRELAARRLVEVRRSIGRVKEASIVDEVRHDRDRDSAS